MLTFEEICEIMGTEPTEVIKCDDGVVMSFGKNDLDEIFGGLFDDDNE